jgi:hypothetical protein
VWSVCVRVWYVQVVVCDDCVWLCILFAGVICTVRADIIHVSVGAVSAEIVSVSL